MESTSPFLNTRSRKRTRDREPSPDMFAVDDEEEDEEVLMLKLLNEKDSSISREIAFDNIHNGIQKEARRTSEPCSPVFNFKQNSRISSTPKLPSESSKTSKRNLQKFSQSTLVNGSAMTNHKENENSGSKNITQTPSSYSSLRSTIGSNRLGLNTRLHEVLRANGSHLSENKYEFSSHASPAGKTQAVYTLNLAETQPTQQPMHSGPNYGLSDNVWRLIQQARGITKLYNWQDQCLKKAVSTDRNLLYSLPTSGGKTLVAEILMIRELLCRGKHCLYILPYVSIVQEKIRTLSSLAVELNFAVEEYAGNRGAIPPRKRKSKKVIYIATLEKAHGIINSLMEVGRLAEIGLVVVDEVHIIGEGKRGATLETLLCKLLLAPASPRVVAMSATIGNIEELSFFLKADIYLEDFRPVQLREFVKIGDQLLEIAAGARRSHLNLMNPVRALPVPTAESRKIDPDGLGVLVAEIAPEHCCLVFCPTKKNCESVAQLIARNLPDSILDWKVEGKQKLKRALEAESGKLCPILRVTIPYGVAYHHSGLTNDERQLIEGAFLTGVLCCLCCTSTLAAGVNLPARRVILRSPYMGSAKLTRARYQQMIGRAGRAGFDTHGESILVVKQQDIRFVTNDILLAPTDRVESQLVEDDLNGLQQLILSLVSLDIGGKDRLALAETLMLSTLFGQQSTERGTAGTEHIDKCINRLLSAKLFAAGADEQLAITKLGKATLKGTVDLERSKELYDDLSNAQGSLSLRNKLHLMYLVTPYDLIGTVPPKPNAYFHAFNKLTEDELEVARHLGINEAAMVKLMSCQQPKVSRRILERFYLTLMLNEMYKGESFWNVAEQYGCTRGDVQNLLSNAASFASCVYHFTQELEEFWPYTELLLPFSKDLSMCCTSELIPLMELPSVSKGRARLLYKAGFRTLADVAKSTTDELVARIEYLPRRIAQQMIGAAKVLVYERVDALRDEADALLELVPKPKPMVLLDETFQTQASNASFLDD